MSATLRLRRALRAATPEPLRLAVALARRGLRDRMAGEDLRFAARPNGERSPQFLVAEVVQPIMRTAFLEGKLHNIGLGARLLDGVTIQPGEVLSFWRTIGRPSERAGFQMGRAIRNGALQGDVGGGLCQLSGIAYEVGLRAGLDVIERHTHSRDIYAEHERFAPLGLDATVVWPWKDLRLRNGLGSSVMFCFTVDGFTLRSEAYAVEPIAPWDLAIDREDGAGERRTAVWREARAGARELVSRDLYVFEGHGSNVEST